MYFETEVHHQPPSATVVTLKGELDVYWAPELNKTLNEAIESVPLIVDLTSLQFIDSTGLAVFVSISRKTSFLRLVRGPARIQKVFEITGLTRIFSFYDSAQEAHDVTSNHI